MKVNVVTITPNPLPQYETPKSAGMDIRADFSRITPENPIKAWGNVEIIFAGEHHTKTLLRLDPGARALIPTGLFSAIPEGYEIQVRPRSGLAAKNGVTVLNTPGTIDSDYRGEVKVILINHGKDAFTVNNGDRIAQLIVAPVTQGVFEKTDELDSTERGEGGFGSTGVNA